MSPQNTTVMASEIAEIPEMLARQLENLARYTEAGRQLQRDGTRGLVLCARGTSDHAATFFKYLMETRAGIPVASIGPSVASVFSAKLRLQGFACVMFSQSGGSPDLAALQAAARQGGARTIAVLNVTDSPLASGAEDILPVLAKPERAVAATKSFVGMLFASLALVAGYTEDTALQGALGEMPDLAHRALACDWSQVGLPLAKARSSYCIGRGLSFAIAAEAALKLKETCRLHAEAYSAAELQHGPIAVARQGFGALIFGNRDQAGESIEAACLRLQELGARSFYVHPSSARATLPMPAANHQVLDPLVQIIAFYRFVEGMARALGYNPDAPTGLQKVTKTL